MAASNILPAGVTTRPDADARSSVVTLADGESTNLSVFATGGVIPQGAIFDVLLLNSNATTTAFKRLTGNEFTTKIWGPGDFYVDRVSLGPTGSGAAIPLGVDKN